MNVFEIAEGASPLIVSIPHAGTFIPDEIKSQMTSQALRTPDTDWHIPRLYDFAAAMDATVISANYSRFVIDLNRPPDNATLYPGQIKFSLCPEETVEGDRIYKDGFMLSATEENGRLEKYWHPYHDELARQIERVKNNHGYALLYDAHSIKSVCPRLFEGILPDINIGTNKGKSCACVMESAAVKAAQTGTFSYVLNGRFIGGYITRHYGAPENNVHALQMELTQKNYMDEESAVFDDARANRLRPVLKGIIQAMLDWGAAEYMPSRTTPAQGLKPNR